MPSGTITLKNNSVAVTGAGTKFKTELAANDFIVAVVGGVTYTLGIAAVASDTSLTLNTAYNGPNASGLAWTPVPNQTMVGITAQVAADTARAIRGLNYDKQNWQQVFSASGNITVSLPDGSNFTGPSWNGLVTSLASKLDSSTVTSSPSKNNNQIPTLGALGLGGAREIGNFSDTNLIGFGRFTPNTTNAPERGSGMGVQLVYDGSSSSSWFVWTTVGGAYIQTTHAPGGQYQWKKVYTEANTTRVSDGTIRVASPVVKLFSDGRYETNNESEGCAVTRLDVGQYLITGCEALNSDAAWGGIDGGFDIPQDRNRQPLVWLDYDVNADGSVLVKTYHRTHPNAPQFAQNNISGLVDGDPIDIPADQYVSVRVQMPGNS